VKQRTGLNEGLSDQDARWFRRTKDGESWDAEMRSRIALEVEWPGRLRPLVCTQGKSAQTKIMSPNSMVSGRSEVKKTPSVQYMG